MCETYSQHAYLHLSGCFYQGFRTGDDGGSGGAYVVRSEERRVGKECRSRWSPYH